MGINILSVVCWLALWTLCSAGVLAQTDQRPKANQSEDKHLGQTDSIQIFQREIGFSADLNGVWSSRIEPGSEMLSIPSEWDGLFLVPFSIDTSLAGVAQGMGSESRLWLSHEFRLPCIERGVSDRVLLRFRSDKNQGISAVWMNGVAVKEFLQGFNHSIYDITENLNEEEGQQIYFAFLAADTDSKNQIGKKEFNWPDFQIECVPAHHIQDLKIHTNSENGFVTLDLKAQVPAGVWTLRSNIGLNSGERAPVQASISSYASNEQSVSTRVVLQVPDPLLGAPGGAKPYQATIDLVLPGGVSDSVSVPVGFTPRERE